MAEANKPTSTRWGVWEWKWDGDAQTPQAEPAVPVVVSDAQKLSEEIVSLQKEISQLQALLGEEHTEVNDRKAKLETLLIRQKENQPAMPHEQKLRKNLWEVRDCDVKLKKLQASLEASKLKTIAAQKEEDDAVEAIASVVKQRDEALETQQNLLLLCKNGGAPPEPGVQKEWVEGMAGLQAFMSVCQAMEGLLSEEDKALLGTMQTIQNRMAQRTAVPEGSPDVEMEVKGGAEKSSRQEDDAGNNPKKQCTETGVASGTANSSTQPGTPPSTASGSAVLAGISPVLGHMLA